MVPTGIRTAMPVSDEHSDFPHYIERPQQRKAVDDPHKSKRRGVLPACIGACGHLFPYPECSKQQQIPLPCSDASKRQRIGRMGEALQVSLFASTLDFIGRDSILIRFIDDRRRYPRSFHPISSWLAKAHNTDRQRGQACNSWA